MRPVSLNPDLLRKEVSFECSDCRTMTTVSFKEPTGASLFAGLENAGCLYRLPYVFCKECTQKYKAEVTPPEPVEANK